MPRPFKGYGDDLTYQIAIMDDQLQATTHVLHMLSQVGEVIIVV
jgi:hypothetical protein